MNSVSPPNDQWAVGLLSLLLILVFVVGAVVAVLFELRRSPQGNQVLRKILAVFAVAGAVIILFVGKFAAGTRPVRPEATVPPQMESHLAAPSPRVFSAPSTDALTAPVTTEAESIKPDIEHPEWTRQTSRVEGANTFVVVKSGRFDTLEVAELHAFDEAGQAAARHFRQFDPSGIGQCVPVQRQLVRDSAIQERFEEISRHDFGTMKDFPMHQVWLQVKLNSQFGERFAEPWRQAAVAARLRTLTGWSVWSTAAAALIAFALRLDSAWNGRRRAIVVGTTAALMLGSLAFLA